MNPTHALRCGALLALAALVPACETEKTTIFTAGGGTGAAPGPRLSALSVSEGDLVPPFDPDTTVYTVGLLFRSDLSITATAGAPDTILRINGQRVPSGTPYTVNLATGENSVFIHLTAPDGRSEAYDLRIHRAVQQAYLKAVNPGSGDFFGGGDGQDAVNRLAAGSGVAVSGDLVAVGAPGEDSGLQGVPGDDSAADSGAVYVFRRAGDSWIGEAYLKASDILAGAQFGFSVALHGDPLAVGAPGPAKTVYVFRRLSEGVWTEEARLPSPSSSPGFFGGSVAVQGDVLVVGDPTEGAKGAVHVFRRTGTSWTQEARLTASNGDSSDFFGCAVAVDGEAIVVGASREEGNGTDPSDNSLLKAGAAYVFRRSGTSWIEEAYLKPSVIDADDRFGLSVAISGDRVAVGAPQEDGGATGVNGDATDNSRTSAGAAYVFRRQGTSWVQEAYVKPSNMGTSFRFGVSVALSGSRLVVGAPGEDGGSSGINGDQSPGLTRSGAVYVYAYTGSGWAWQAYIKASNPNAEDSFGSSIAFDGVTLVVSAPSEASSSLSDQSDNNAPGSGAAYVFR